jgi:Berberine and berberine like
VHTTSYRAALGAFDPYIVNGRRKFLETCWLPALGAPSIDLLMKAMETAVSPGCAIFTHEFKGAASQVPAGSTAFGLRRDQLLVEILATFADQGDELEEHRHRQWARDARHAFNLIAFTGGYPNLLAGDDPARAANSYGGNGERLIKAKRRYDPDNVFRSAIPLPTGHYERRAPSISQLATPQSG